MIKNLKLITPSEKPLSAHDFHTYLNDGCKDKQFEEKINARVSYVFQKLKEITNSTIQDFSYINAYDNDNSLGHFNAFEFQETVSLCGNFSNKYDKPFGFSFPTQFIFNDFEQKSALIYVQYLEEKAMIFDDTCCAPSHIIPKEYSYDRMISDLSKEMSN